MARTPNPYVKLPGRGLRRVAVAVSATRCRLWLAPDHLLAVDFTIASEDYRRFYFRDIEAFVLRRTAHRQVWNWIFLVLGLLTAGPFVIGWRSSGNGGLGVAALSFAAFWLIFILVNTLRGGTCQTHIRTAVQFEQLPSLGRLPVARKVLARLQPLIVAAQGAATPEEVGAAPWMAEEKASSAATQRPIRADKGTLHGALFGLLIAEAILTGIFYALYQQALSTPGMLAMLGGFIICVVALMRQAATDLPAGVRHIAKWALGYYIVKCVIGFVYTMVFAIHNPGTPVVTGLEIVGEPGFAIVSLASVGVGAIIGLVGLIQVLAHRRNRAALPVS
jgi:hypothetical protein